MMGPNTSMASFNLAGAMGEAAMTMQRKDD
jgi:hypothetical protein